MSYLKRDDTGNIVDISKEPAEGFVAAGDAESAEVEAFLMSLTGSEFQTSDLSFIRVLDDLIDLLIDKNIILFTELPPAVQDKYTRRAEMRQRRRDALNLLEDADII